MRFLINEVLDYPTHYESLSSGAEATPDTVEAILEGAATICEEGFDGNRALRTLPVRLQ